MKAKTIDELLVRISRLRIICLVLTILMLGFSAILIRKAALLTADRYLPAQGILLAILLSAALLFLVTWTIVRYRYHTVRKIAMQLDSRYQLKDRLSTYMEIRDQDHPFLKALTHDLEQHLGAIRIWHRTEVQRLIGGPSVFLCLMILACITIPLLPVPSSIQSRQQDLRQVHQAAKQLESDINKLTKEKEESAELKKFLQQALQEAKKLQEPNIDKADALARLNALKNQLNQLSGKMGDAKQQDLAAMAQQLKEDASKTAASNPDAAKAMDEMAKQIEQSLAQRDSNFRSGKEGSTSQKSFSMNDPDKWKKALEDYKKQSADRDKRLAEMQRSLDNAKKCMAGGSHQIVKDSRIPDREIEKGGASVDDGPGTTNQDVGPHHFDTKKKGGQSYAEDRTKSDYERIYKGERTRAESDPLFLNSHWNDESEARTENTRGLGLPSPAQVDGHSYGLTVQDQNETEIRKERVPASYRNLVNSYLESIHTDQQPEPKE